MRLLESLESPRRSGGAEFRPPAMLISMAEFYEAGFLSNGSGFAELSPPDQNFKLIIPIEIRGQCCSSLVDWIRPQRYRTP